MNITANLHKDIVYKDGFLNVTKKLGQIELMRAITTIKVYKADASNNSPSAGQNNVILSHSTGP